MERENRSLHMFYFLVPIVTYIAVNFAATILARCFQWNHWTLNVFAQLMNLIILYLCFYRPYRQKIGKDFLPPLLLGGPIRNEEKKIPPQMYVWVILLGICCSMALNGWFYFLQLDQTFSTYEKVAESIYSGGTIGIWLRTIVLASLLEELLMRGLCYHAMSHVIGRAGGMLLSSLLFGYVHGNWLQGLYAFILGILFAFVYDRYQRNLMAPILAHMSANLVSVLGTTVPGISLFLQRNFFICTMISTIFLVIAVVGIIKCFSIKT